METQEQIENINECLAQLQGEINTLKIILSHCKQTEDSNLADCIDRINKLQNKAKELHMLLHGSNNVQAQLICNATCAFCEAATKHLCASKGCIKQAKTSSAKVCKVCKLFENFYQLFK